MFVSEAKFYWKYLFFLFQQSKAVLRDSCRPVPVYVFPIEGCIAWEALWGLPKASVSDWQQSFRKNAHGILVNRIQIYQNSGHSSAVFLKMLICLSVHWSRPA